MLARGCIALLLVTSTGCDELSWEASLREVIPRTWIEGERPAVRIVGDGLFVEVVVDFASPRGVRTRADFAGTLGGEPLEAVVWVNNEELTAGTPTLPPGDHDLEIVRAGYDSVALAGAVTVESRDLSVPSGPPWDFDPPVAVGGDINQPPDTDDDLTFGPELSVAYFSSNRSGVWDIYSAPFNVTTMTLGTASAITEVNSPQADDDNEINSDGLTLIFASTRPGTGGLWLATRPDLTSPFDAPTSLGAYFGDDPTISEDGLELIYDCSDAPCRATRASVTVAFGAAYVIPEVDTTEDEYDFFLTVNGLHLWFCRNVGSLPDIYVATRPDRTAAFDTAIAVDDINTPFKEREPWLSADGTLLFFTSDRTGVDVIYVSRRR